MPSDHETTRVRNLSDQELLEYIDMNGTDSPERKHALHVLEERNHKKNREKLDEVIQAAKQSSGYPKSLLNVLRRFFWIPLTIIALVIGFYNDILTFISNIFPS